MPLAPAATLLARFPDGLAQALAAHDVPEAFITQELSRMQDVRLGKTASRSVLGIMNEFTFLAQTMRGDTTTDLTDLARWLARRHCQLEQSEGDFRRFASAIHQLACDV